MFNRWFDALTVGGSFETHGRTITEADLVGFSSLTGDWHPNHDDAEWAARGRFRGRIVHGLLLVSCGVGLLPIDPERVVAMSRIVETRFKAPGRVGDTIRLAGRVKKLTPVDDSAGLVQVSCSILRHENEVLVHFTPEVLWLRRPSRVPDADDDPALWEVDVPV